MSRRSGGRDLAGLVVAITGGGRGIGRATAARFAAGGARVVIGDVDSDVASAAAAELGRGVHGAWVDVADPASFAAFLDEAEDAHGPLDVVVNNAGVMPIGSLADSDPATLDRVVDINLRGVITGSRLATERFRAHGGGHLINLASILGIVSSPNVAVYNGTKAAVIAFTDALRTELRREPIAVTAVLPGYVRTELIAGMSTNPVVDRLLTVEADDVAAAIVRAVERGRRGEVFVPASAGVTTHAVRLLPARARDAVLRALGSEKNTAGVDRAARAAYEERALRR